jgi:hypothetical protein
MYTQTQRRSSTSATRTAREHNHATTRSPTRTSDEACPACAGLGVDLRKGLGPLPLHRPPSPGDTGTSSPLRTLRLDRDASARCQPRLLGPEAGRLSPPDTSHHPLGSDWWSFSPTRFARTPLVTRSLRRWEEPSTAGHPAEAERHSSDPVAQAEPRAQTRDSWLAWPPHSPLSRDRRPEQPPQHLLTQIVRVHPRRSTSLLTHPMLGPRAASPESPRRDPRSAAPEVPSVDELPSERFQAFAWLARPRRVFPQAVASMWKTLGAASRLLHDPAALTYRGRRRPRLRYDQHWAETQHFANWAAGLTPAAAPASQHWRTRELTSGWKGLGADVRHALFPMLALGA